MFFCRGLRSKELIVLDLTNSEIGPVAASEIGRGSFPCLEILRMQSNRLRSEGLAGLFATGLGSKRMKYLQLNQNELSTNALGAWCDTGMQALGQSLHSYRRTLEILDLSSNNIDDGGIHSLSLGIETMERLSVLKMRYGAREVYGKKSIRNRRMNDGISDQGGVTLARALNKSMLLRTEHTSVVSSRSRRSNKKRYSKKKDKDGIQLLTLVDLRGHRISSQGTIALVRSMYGNGRGAARGVETMGCRLMLQGNPTIGEAVVRPLATSMKWDGSLEFMRRKIVETFGIWKGGDTGEEEDDDDDDKQEFQWKVRSQQLEQNRKRTGTLL
jgi:hypothetical protein